MTHKKILLDNLLWMNNIKLAELISEIDCEYCPFNYSDKCKESNYSCESLIYKWLEDEEFEP